MALIILISSAPTAPSSMAQNLFYFNCVYLCISVCGYVYTRMQAPAESEESVRFLGTGAIGA